MRPGGGSTPSGAELIGLSAMLALAVVVPLLAGLALDSALHRGPLFLMIGLLVGIGAAAVAAYTRFRRYL